MKQYEVELANYLTRKESNSELTFEIQQYAKAEVDSVFDKSSKITSVEVFSYLLNANHFDPPFIFWLSCYSENIKSLPPDAMEFVKLLVVMFDNEEIKAGMIQNKLDLELIESFLTQNKSTGFKIAEEMLKRTENQWQKGKLNFGHLFTWLTKIFNTLNKANIKDESLNTKTCKQSIEILKGFHSCSNPCKGNIFAFPLILDIMQLLITVIKISPDIQSVVLSLIWRLCEDRDYTLKEKVELCYFFQDYFVLIPEIVNNENYWDLILEGISTRDIIINKYSIQLLKRSVKEPNETWKTFFDIFDMYESYESSFSKERWSKIDILFNHIEKHQGNKSPLEDMNKWVEALLKQINNIENKQLKKHAIKYLLRKKKYPLALLSYFAGDFFKLLNNSGYYRRSKLYIKDDSIPLLIPEFVRVITSSENFGFVLISVQKWVTKFELFLCIVKGFSLIDEETQFVTDSEVELLSELLHTKTKGISRINEYQLAKYLLTFLHQHMNITKITFLPLSKILSFIPTSFYCIGGIGEMKYKNMLLLMLQEIITPSKILLSLTTQILSLYSNTPSKEEFNSSLLRFASLCKIFGILINTLDFDNPSIELDNITDALRELLEKLGHSISSLYAKPFPVVSSLVMLQAFVHYFVKLGSSSAINYLIPFISAYLAHPLGDYFSGISGQFLNPKEIKEENKERLTLFVTYKDPILKLLSDTALLIGYSTKSPTKLDKFSSYLISYTKLLLKSQKKNKSCTSIGLAIILLMTDKLLMKYCKIKEPNVILEKVLDNVFPLLTQLQEAKLTEDSFDSSTDQITNQFINYWDAVKIAMVSQMHLIEEFTLIGQLNPTSKDMIIKNSADIINSIHEHMLPLIVDDIAQPVLQSIYNCITTLYKDFITLSEENKSGLIELAKKAWDKWGHNSNYKILASLFGVVFHPVAFKFLEIRNSSQYENLTGKVLFEVDKNPLAGRAFLGQLVLLLTECPECIKGIEDLLVNFALSHTEKTGDNANVLAKSYFRVSTAAKRNVYYEEIDSYGSFIRVSMIELFDMLIINTKKAMLKEGWEEFNSASTSKESINNKFSKHILVLESLVKMMLKIINTFITHSNEQKKAPIAYSTEYRQRLSMGQYTTILIKVFDKKVFTNYFRETLCEIDPIVLIIEELKSALECSNAPILRNYFEVSVVKLALEFPEEVLKLLVVPIIHNATASMQIRTSVVFIACAVMDRTKDDKIQLELLKELISYIGAHSGFTRALTQIYLQKYSSMLPEENKKFLEPYFDCLKEDRSAIKLASKVYNQLDKLGLIIDNTSSTTIASSQRNDFGEAISNTYAELVKTAISALACVNMANQTSLKQ